MDSEQIKKGSSNQTLFDISGQLHPGSSIPLKPAPDDHRKLKGQVIARPSEKGILKPTECPIDPWEHDSASIEHTLFSDIDTLLATSISDKTELKKYLSELYKQAHDLMTRYNQRILSLLMDDRFLYRHSSEISALMIRRLMPPLEEIKTLGRSLTSTRKKLADEPIEKFQKSANAELEKIKSALNDAKNRITKHTKPLKPSKLIQKQLDQCLEQAASELNPQIQRSAEQEPANNSRKTLPKTQTGPAKTLPLKALKKKEQDTSPENLTSKQLKMLAVKLDESSIEDRKHCTLSILSYLESEYRRYAPVKPLLSVAKQKSELLSMIPDKACKTCQEDIQLLENSQSLKEAELSLEKLIDIDKAINRLAAFDKKLPGEVWQLLTELTPNNEDNSRYHLLNMLCRKLLLDGPTPLTQKAVLNKFQDVLECQLLLREKANNEVFDRQFIAACGQVFTSPTLLKKNLNIINKPHEVYALIQMFSRQTNNKTTLITKTLEKLNTIDTNNVEPRKILLSGLAAFDFLVKELPEKLSAEISNYHPSEPNQIHRQLKQSIFKKYSNYFKAVELAGKHKEGAHKQNQQNYGLSQISKKLSELLINPRLSDDAMNIGKEILSIINQNPTDSQEAHLLLSKCRSNIISALAGKQLPDSAAMMIIKLFLETQTLIEQSKKSAQENSFQPPQNILEALASLENGASPKWYNQRFTTHIMEQRTNALKLVNNILNACKQTIAAPTQVACFIEASALELTKENEDPLIKQLGAEMQNYAKQLKTL